jgi:uracil phosphoribosyltransferase
MFVLNHNPSIANQFLAELRNIHIQKDKLKFRTNLERLGEILAYELSKSLDYTVNTIQTPLAKTTVFLPKNTPVLIGILRAALPFYQGFLNYFDQSESGFIGAYRQENNTQNSHEVNISYLYQALPEINHKEIILIDPMLATGKSLVESIQHLSSMGKPSKIHIASVIAAPEGIEYIKKEINEPVSFWIGAIDDRLNEQYYIVPGLGDAGDLAFGTKIS